MWAKLVLDDACDLITRGISPKYLETGGIRVLNQKCIRNHSIDYGLARRHDISKKGIKEERYIQKGDVLINSTGHGTLGRVAQVRHAPDEPTTVDSHVTIVRPKPELFYLDYFGYAAIFIEDAIKDAGQGTSGQTELSKTKLKEEFFVNFPSGFDEQQRIVAKLDAAFAEIDVAIEAAVTKETEVQKLKASLLSSSFSGAAVMCKKAKLGDLFKIGSSKRVLKAEWKDSGVPFYRGREITTLSKTGNVNNDLFISEEHFSELKSKHGVPQEGDLLVTAIGTIGNTYIVREQDRFYFKDASVLWLQKISSVDIRFVDYWFKSSSFFEQLEVGNGATVDTLSISKLNVMDFPLPPLSEQQRIVAKLDAIFNELVDSNEAIEQSKTNYQALKSAILTQELQSEAE